ncbi:MAG: hypothetical protein HFG68_08820 [Hungatella sp.]|nr:hypothetical protein [Hungatella sp.]
MSIMMVTSLNTYTKNMEMKMKWQKKQSSKDYSADGSTTIKDSVQRQLEDIRESQKDGSKQMSAQIELKMTSGKRLTAAEMEYLKENDPQTYQKAKAIEMEREAYERELKNCKTKEEVERVKAAHAAAALDRVNDVKNNPNIPGGKKLELIKQELFKSSVREEAMQNFVKSGEYKKLPTEAERLKAEKDMEEAKKAELGLDEESKKEDSKEESIDNTQETEAGKFSDSVTQEMPSQAESIKKALLEIEAKEVNTETVKRKMTRAQAEVTPEARKVRQAKAKAAYAMNQARLIEGASPSIDIKK